MSICGNDQIGPGYGCSWSAVPSGGVPPYSYPWTVNGTPVGGNTDYLNYTSDGNNFTIAVTDTDSQSGNGSGQKGVRDGPGGESRWPRWGVVSAPLARRPRRGTGANG